MAEFPDIGAHCSVPECRQLDYLPIKCDACFLILCKDHRTYESHRCREAYKKDLQVPICPLCQRPVPIKRGETPDIRVNEHIEQDCQSDLAGKRKSMLQKCGIRGCLKKELIKMECQQCGIHFCLGHRHPTDHECKRVRTQKTNEEDDDADLAKALHESLNMKQREMDPEQLNFLLAQQLQQEEFERAQQNGNQRARDLQRERNGQNCAMM